MSGNIEERMNHVWEIKKKSGPWWGQPWLADNPKYHKEKCVSLESFNIAKCKMLKNRKNEIIPTNIKFRKKKIRKK